jgi:hypothetical protein
MTHLPHKIIRLIIFLGLVLPATNSATAGQTEIKNYKETREKYFFARLYQKGGFTLYCGKWFPVEVEVVPLIRTV